MQINFEDFNVRKSNSYVAGTYGLPKNVERYIIQAQGLIGFDIFSGDEISIKNIEGQQICEIVSFNKEGICNLSVLNKNSNSDAKFIKHVLTNSFDKKILLRKLKNKNINFNNATSFNFFNKETKAGDNFNFIVQEDGFVILSAPGEEMEVDSQNVSSDLEVKVKRLNKINKKLEDFLPDPLADTKNEFLIKDSTALAYEVNKDDYIQIIDLYGRHVQILWHLIVRLYKKARSIQLTLLQQDLL